MWSLLPAAVSRWMAAPDTRPAAEPANAAGAPWYAGNAPIILDGLRFILYGVPRAFGPGALARINTLRRVAVAPDRRRSIIDLPVWLLSMPRIPILLLATLLTLAALPLAGQAGAPSDTTLPGRMRAFLREVPDAPNTELAAYFPRRGDWTWEQTLLDRRGIATRVVVRRFPGADTPRVIGAGGPACLSFDGIRGDFGPFEGRFGMQARMNPGPWRRVRGNRFVPRGASVRSPVFVEWRREDGQWVVAAFGEEEVYAPRLLGRPAGPFVRDTTLFPEDAAFDPANWPVVTIDGRRYAKYGLPRPIERALLSRVGVLNRVSVYTERPSALGWTEHVYLATAPGEYQPYVTAAPMPCD